MSDDNKVVAFAKAQGGGPRVRLPEQQWDIRWLTAYAQEPIPQDVVRGVIARGGITVFVGPYGAGKTFLVLYLAYCISENKPFFDREVDQGVVVLISAEGPHGLKARGRALLQQPGVKWKELNVAVVPHPVDLYSCDTDHVVNMIREVVGDAKVALFGVDTLNANMGDGDENSASDIRVFYNNVRSITRKLGGCGAAVLHHPGKDASKGARGNYAIIANADISVNVKCIGGNEHSATIEKQRDGLGGTCFNFSLRAVDVRLQQDEVTAYTSCYVVCGTATQGAVLADRPKKLNDAEVLLLDVFKKMRKTEKLPSNPARKGVTDDALRAEYKRQYPGLDDDDGKDPTRKATKAFKRALTGLLAAGLISSDQGVLWSK